MKIYGNRITIHDLILCLDPENPKSYPKSGNTLYDLSDKKNDADIVGPQFNINSFKFNGTTDYILLPQDLEYTDKFSVFAFVKRLGIPSGDYNVICGNFECEVSIVESSGKLKTSITTDQEFTEEYGSGLNDGNYHQVGFTYDGVNKVSYIDGVNVGTQVCSGTLVSKSTNRTIGRLYVVEYVESIADYFYGPRSMITVANDGRLYGSGVNTGNIFLQQDSDSIPMYSRYSTPIIISNDFKFSYVSITENYAIGINSENNLPYIWGEFSNSVLNFGSFSNKSSPTLILGNMSFIDVTMYENMLYGIRGDNTVWVCGKNEHGSLGTGNGFHQKSPVAVVGNLKCTNKISSNGINSFIINEIDGSAWGWGHNTYGQLGIGSIISQASPVSMLGGISFSDIQNATPRIKTYYTVGLSGSDGSAWAWGQNTYGQLGNNTRTNTSSPVSMLGGISFSKIYVGEFSFYGLRGSDGSAWSCGTNSSGQLGNGDDVLTGQSSPVSVLGGISFSQLIIGEYCVFGIRGSDGSAWAWGKNLYGQLGDMSRTDKNSPVSVLGGISFSKIYIWSTTALGIRGSDGSAWSWGNNGSGQLGDGTTLSRSSPTSVLGGISFSKISVDNINVYGISGSDGSAWAWGSNSSGQIGDGTTFDRISPTSVLGGISFKHISSQHAYNVVGIRGFDGALFTWGSNAYGQLAIDQADQYAYSPTPIDFFENMSISMICGNQDNIMVLDSTDGSVWGFGTNSSGMLGDGTAVKRNSPVSVLGEISFTQIRCERYHALGLRGSDGSAWSWGLNQYGQLGDGTTTAKSSPISVLGEISFSYITIGEGLNNAMVSSYGIRGSDGSAWSWGNNSNGQLGDGTTLSRSSPTSVLGGISFTKIFSCNNHVIGIRGSDGSAWAWGRNNRGQLGDRTTTNRSSPVSVLGGISWKSIVCAYESSYGIRGSDNSAWAWGDNFYGQLGGENSLNTSPVSVKIPLKNIQSYLNGEISYFLMYDRDLSEDEVSQNFNSLKKRFGL